MRRRIELSDAIVARYKAPKRDRLIFDARCSGLALRLRRGGGKRYVFIVSDCTGARRYLTIGDPALMSLAAARAACEPLRSEYCREDGIGKNEGCPSFGDFVAGSWTRQCLNRQKPRSQKRCEVALRTQLLPIFGKMRLDAIGRVDCLKWFDHYSRTAPGGANRTLDILRQIFGAAVSAGHISHNPAKGITKNKSHRPMRFLNGSELVRLNDVLRDSAAKSSSAAEVSAIIRQLLLTGCRSGEILGLRWADVVESAGANAGAFAGEVVALLEAHAALTHRQAPQQQEAAHVQTRA